MTIGVLRVSALVLLAATATACAEEPTEFTGSSTASAGPAGPGPSSGEGGGGARSGDGGSSAAGDGGRSSSSSPDTSSGDGGDSTSTEAGSGGAPPQTVDFELELDDTAPDIDLRSTVSVALDIVENGYMGTVILDVGGLPDDVIANLDEDTVTLDGSGTTTVQIEFETFSDTVSGDLDFTVTGATEDGNASTVGLLVVHPTLTITIPQNLVGFDGQDDAFGPNPTMISLPPGGISEANPVTIRFFNADGVPHEIHAENPDQGFPHSMMSIPAGGMDGTPRNVNTAGTYDFYPHDLDGVDIPGSIVIQ